MFRVFAYDGSPKSNISNKFARSSNVQSLWVYVKKDDSRERVTLSHQHIKRSMPVVIYCQALNWQF